MKNLIYFLIAAMLVGAGCKKSPKNTKPPVDESAALNKKLTGKWLYATTRTKVVANNGTVLTPDTYLEGAAAYEFDGTNKFTGYYNINITDTATYAVHKQNGLYYVDITYPVGPASHLRIQTLNDSTLELTDTIPANGTPNARQMYFYTHTKMKAADTARNFRVWMMSDSIINVTTFITNAVRPDFPVVNKKIYDFHTSLQDQKPYYYTYSHTIYPGDFVTLTMNCYEPRTFAYIYYQGIDITDTRADYRGLYEIKSFRIPGK